MQNADFTRYAGRAPARRDKADGDDDRGDSARPDSRWRPYSNGIEPPAAKSPPQPRDTDAIVRHEMDREREERRREKAERRRQEYMEKRRSKAEDKGSENTSNAAAKGDNERQRYRDRAAERRQTNDALTDGAEMVLSAGIAGAEESRYLGGDADHAHLVKGLDFALLRKQRKELAESEKAPPSPRSSAPPPAVVKKLEDDRKQARTRTIMARRVLDAVHSQAATESARARKDSGGEHHVEQFLPGRSMLAFDVSTRDRIEWADQVPTETRRSRADCPPPPVTHRVDGHARAAEDARPRAPKFERELNRIMSALRASTGVHAAGGCRSRDGELGERTDDGASLIRITGSMKPPERNAPPPSSQAVNPRCEGTVEEDVAAPEAAIQQTVRSADSPLRADGDIDMFAGIDEPPVATMTSNGVNRRQRRDRTFDAFGRVADSNYFEFAGSNGTGKTRRRPRSTKDELLHDLVDDKEASGGGHEQKHASAGNGARDEDEDEGEEEHDVVVSGKYDDQTKPEDGYDSNADAADENPNPLHSRPLAEVSTRSHEEKPATARPDTAPKQHFSGSSQNVLLRRGGDHLQRSRTYSKQ